MEFNYKFFGFRIYKPNFFFSFSKYNSCNIVYFITFDKCCTEYFRKIIAIILLILMQSTKETLGMVFAAWGQILVKLNNF